MKIKKHFEKRIEDYSKSFPNPSMAKQSFKNDCDIHHILKRYDKSGVLDHVNDSKARYGDFVNVDDYHASLDKVMRSEELFDSLPSKVRSKFENDPGQFLDFVGNPENRDEMIELGLMSPDVTEEYVEAKKASKKEKKNLPEKVVANSQQS